MNNTEYEANYNKDNIIVNSFEEMGLKEDLLRGIYSYGFESPSTIQQKGIIPVIRGKDSIVQAQSGTGKTLTFLVAGYQRIDNKNKNCQILIISPTHELCNQITDVARGISVHMQNTYTATCIGGKPIYVDKTEIRKGKQVIIGTPGRILDLIERNILKTDSIKMLIMDEADQLLSSFSQKIYDIFQYMNPDIQVALYSATITNETLQITKKFMRDPFMLSVKTEELTLEGIKQYYIDVTLEKYKQSTLEDLLGGKLSLNQLIIYCNSIKKVEEITSNLIRSDFTVASIHGSLPQTDREEILKNFRSCKSRVLVTTDLLARGIDVQTVSLVINYDFPNSTEEYIHRIGRSGRYGRKGTAVTFVTNDDVYKIRSLEKFYDTQIEEMPDPDEVNKYLQ